MTLGAFDEIPFHLDPKNLSRPGESLDRWLSCIVSDSGKLQKLPKNSPRSICFSDRMLLVLSV